jgi:hypothetical protein
MTPQAIAAACAGHTMKAPFSIAEVGFGKGDRAREILREVIKHGQSRIHYFVFDAFGGEGTINRAECLKLLHSMRGVEHVRICSGNAADFLEVVPELPPLDLFVMCPLLMDSSSDMTDLARKLMDKLRETGWMIDANASDSTDVPAAGSGA